MLSPHPHFNEVDSTLTRAGAGVLDQSRQRYGSPAFTRDLIEPDERVSRKRVIHLMQEDGLEARAQKRFKHTTMRMRGDCRPGT
jgi:transposase InsO family protein